MPKSSRLCEEHEPVVNGFENVKGLSIFVSELPFFGLRNDFPQIGVGVLVEARVVNQEEVVKHKAIISFHQVLDHFRFREQVIQFL